MSTHAPGSVGDRSTTSASLESLWEMQNLRPSPDHLMPVCDGAWCRSTGAANHAPPQAPAPLPASSLQPEHLLPIPDSPCLASLAASAILIHRREQNLPCIDVFTWSGFRHLHPEGGQFQEWQNISPTPSGHWTSVNIQLGSRYLESKTQAPCQCPQASPSGPCLTPSSTSYLSPLCLWRSSHQPDLPGDPSWGMFFTWLALYINCSNCSTNPSEVEWDPSPVLFTALHTMRNHHICSFIDRFIGYFLTHPLPYLDPMSGTEEGPQLFLPVPRRSLVPRKVTSSR